MNWKKMFNPIPSLEEGRPRKRAPGRFYERGCQEKYLPDRPAAGTQASWQPAHVSVETTGCSGFVSILPFINNVVLLQKLKSGMGIVADHGSI